jgi:hypothetical protein
VSLSWLSWRTPFLLRSVIVNLKDDHDVALQGVLWSVRGPWLSLRNAAILKSGQPPTPADGELFIHRDNVAFVQVA